MADIIFIKMTTAVFKAQNFAVYIGKAQNHVRMADLVKMADLFLVIHIIFIKMTMAVKMVAKTETKQNKTKQTPFLRNFEILFLT